jgi:hypothetical protein
VRQVGDEIELADRHRVALAYWASFSDYLTQNSSTFRIRRAKKDHWFTFGIGRTGFVISATISTEKRRIGVELYAYDDSQKVAFHALYAQKDGVEKELGEPLEWQELPGKKAIRIALFKRDVDPSDEKQYPALHTWMLEKMERFKTVFADRIRLLPVGSVSDEEDGSPSDD